MLWHYCTCRCSCYALFDKMSYVQRKVWNFVHSWVLLKDYNIFMCAVKTKKKVLEVWVDFSLSSKLNFLKVFFDTDLPKKIPYSPLVRKRWAWARTQRWSTWWRWSSCRTAGPSAREELRQTRYRRLGQNTDVKKKGLKCVRNYSSCAAFLG